MGGKKDKDLSLSSVFGRAIIQLLKRKDKRNRVVEEGRTRPK